MVSTTKARKASWLILELFKLLREGLKVVVVLGRQENTIFNYSNEIKTLLKSKGSAAMYSDGGDPSTLPKCDFFDKNLEFDAPQWADFEKEKQIQRSGEDVWSPISDTYANWFQDEHPLHDDHQTEPIPPRKLSDNTVQEIVKKQRKKWKANEGGLPTMPRKQSTIPKDMLPKRASSSTNNSQCPSRSSNDRNSTCKTSAKPTKPSREIPPQNDSRPSSVKNKNSKESSCGIAKKVLVAKDRKQPQFDLNGRRIIKGCPQTCPAPVEMNTRNSKAKLRRSVDVVSAAERPRPKRKSCFTFSSEKEASSKSLDQKSTTSRQVVSKFPRTKVTRWK